MTSIWFFTIAGIVVFDMSLLAGTLGMPELRFMGLWAEECVIGVTEFIRIVIEMCVGIGVTALLDDTSH